MEGEEAGIESCLENQEEWEHESDEETLLQLDVKENSWEAQTNPDSYRDIVHGLKCHFLVMRKDKHCL